MCFQRDGKIAGVLADIVFEAFHRAGQPVDIMLWPWARCLEQARVGAIDGVFPIFKTPEREAALAFATEVLMSQVETFFVRKDSTFTYNGDLGSVARYRIGLQNKVSYGQHLDQAVRDGLFPNISYANEPNFLIRMLVGGHVDVIAIHRDEAWAMARALKIDHEIRQVDPSLETVNAYLAFTQARNFAALLRALDGAMHAMRSEGVFDAIHRRYEGG
jgi:polar amino acid transport system substrate-binding protein